MMVVHYKDETVDVFDDVYDCITKHGIITIQYDAEEERVYPKDESGLDDSRSINISLQ